MDSEFVKFPRTPHLAWLGKGAPRGDKLLSPAQARRFLSQPIVVEEKVDGTAIGFSIGESGEARVQSRGSYVTDFAPVQFKPLRAWLAEHAPALLSALGEQLLLFGEWCYARHTVPYDALPDWFLAYDVYDRGAGRYWTAGARDRLTSRLGLASVPRLAEGRFDLAGLRRLLGPSRLGAQAAEGLYLRSEAGGFLVARAKLVRPEWIPADEEHWSRRPVEPNRIARRPPARIPT